MRLTALPGEVSQRGRCVSRPSSWRHPGRGLGGRFEVGRGHVTQERVQLAEGQRVVQGFQRADPWHHAAIG